MKNHQNHQMAQLYLSAVTCLLFLVTRDDVKRENKTTMTFQPPGQKLEQHKTIISLIEEYERNNYWAGRHQMKAMSLEQSKSIKNGLIIFFFSPRIAFRPFQSFSRD